MSDKDFKCHCPHLDEFSRETEGNFTAIKETLNHMEGWLGKISRNMAQLLEMHGIHEASLNYNSRMISDHERRIYKLERRIS